MGGQSDQTYISTIIFLDIVGYSKTSNRNQILLKSALHEAITFSLGTYDRNALILTDTGDGAALGFLWNPEAGLQFARRFRDWLQASDGSWQVRIGLHLGPITVSEDLNGHRNMVGDGINSAQRVMSFADPGRILVSQAYHDAVIRLDHDYEGIFSPPKEFRDKHGRIHVCQELLPKPADSERPAASEVDEPRLDRQPPPEVAHDKISRQPLLVGTGLMVLLVGFAWLFFSPTQEVPAPRVSDIGPPASASPDAVQATPAPAVAYAPARSQPTTTGPKPTAPSPDVQTTLSSHKAAPAVPDRDLGKDAAKQQQVTNGEGPAKLRAGTGEFAAASRPDCPNCNCPDLLTKLSMGTEPLNAAQQAFLKENCR